MVFTGFLQKFETGLCHQIKWPPLGLTLLQFHTLLGVSYLQIFWDADIEESIVSWAGEENNSDK